MKTKQKILGLTFILISKLVTGQVIGFEKIDDSKVTPWIPKLTSEYQYVYHFGDSEMESDFVFILGIDLSYAQIKSGTWSEDGKSWIRTYKNLTNVRVQGNKFFSDETNGEFVVYDNGQEKIQGLKIYNSWSGMTENGEYEIGIKSYPITEYFNGKFPQASMRIMPNNEIGKMSKADLKIMRNEIFARYGYRFKSGGEMDAYFRTQSWYNIQHDNVNDFLTGIENANIFLIKFFENK